MNTTPTDRPLHAGQTLDLAGSQALPPALASAQRNQSAFWRPKYLSASPTLAQLPFLFWLVEALRPRRIVELGVGAGVSYLALCQAVEKLGLSTRCHGIDHGAGDATAEVGAADRAAARAYHDQQYTEFSELIEAEAAVAPTRFEGTPIDLLHVDLEITPDLVESLRHDWLPKLSEGATLLLQGTETRFADGAAREFLDALLTRHASFRLRREGGCALVLIGEGHAEQLTRLTRLDPEDPAHDEAARALGRLGLACRLEWQASAETARAETAEGRADKLAARLSEKNERLATLDSALDAARHKTAEAQAKAFDLEEARRTDREETERLQRETARLTEDMEARFREIAVLTQELESLKKTRTEDAAKAKQAEQEAKTADAQRKQTEKDRETAKQDLDRRFHELSVLTDRLAHAEADRDTARQREHRFGLLRDLAKARLHARTRRRSGLPNRRKEAALLKASPFFDAAWYRETYPDVAEAGADPLAHFLDAGLFEGRNPGPHFNTMAYYEANPDIARTGFNALVHYLMFGQDEGRPTAL